MNISNLPIFCETCKKEFTRKDGSCSLKCEVRKFKEGEKILKKGEEVNSVYFLIQGKVIVKHSFNSGVLVVVESITAPFPLAAFMIFSKKRHYIIDICAVTDCEIYVFPKETIEKQMIKCKEFMRGFTEYNADRSVRAYEKILFYSLKGIKAKVVHYILSIENDLEFNFEMNISEMANSFGVERPSLSRAISDLVKDGCIEFNRGGGRILDLEALTNHFG